MTANHKRGRSTINELQETRKQLPNTIEEKAEYVLFGTDALMAYRAQLAAIKKKFGFIPEQYKQLEAEAQATAENVLMFSVDVGGYISEIPKATTNHKNLEIDVQDNFLKPKADVITELGFTPRQARDMQTISKHPDIVQEVIDEARESGDVASRSAVLRKINEEKKPHVVNNSKDDEWYTPARYIDAAREVMGSIDLDPASNDFANQTVMASEYYSEETNGLLQEWYGNIWMNPPYSTALLSQFADKLANSSFEQAIVLVNNATETAWFEKMVSKATAVVFHKGRIRFVKRDGEHGAPLQGQAFIYYGDNAGRFLDVFGQFGWGAML